MINYRQGGEAVRNAWFAYKKAGGHNIPAFVAGWNAAMAQKEVPEVGVSAKGLLEDNRCPACNCPFGNPDGICPTCKTKCERRTEDTPLGEQSYWVKIS